MGAGVKFIKKLGRWYGLFFGIRNPADVKGSLAP
jgi:hypothetical protein